MHRPSDLDAFGTDRIGLDVLLLDVANRGFARHRDGSLLSIHPLPTSTDGNSKDGSDHTVGAIPTAGHADPVDA